MSVSAAANVQFDPVPAPKDYYPSHRWKGFVSATGDASAGTVSTTLTISEGTVTGTFLLPGGLFSVEGLFARRVDQVQDSVRVQVPGTEGLVGGSSVVPLWLARTIAGSANLGNNAPPPADILPEWIRRMVFRVRGILERPLNVTTSVQVSWDTNTNAVVYECYGWGWVWPALVLAKGWPLRWGETPP